MSAPGSRARAWGAAAVAVAVAAIAVAFAVASGARATPDRGAAEAPPFGFDHLVHEGKVSVSGHDPIPCTDCHPMTEAGGLVGRPDHGACFGACHGAPPPPRRLPRRGPAPPYPVTEERHPLCVTCHAPAALERVAAGAREALTVSYPPYDRDRDYGVRMSHAVHATETDCVACHARPAEPGAAPAPAPPPHARCAPCHAPPGRAAPAIADCAGCHPAAYGPATGPHLVRGAFPVTATFSHRAHAERAGDDGCTTCHAAVVVAGGDALPAPDTARCAGCHDGRGAFSTVDASCRRCHTRPAREDARPEQPVVRFSHLAHQQRGMTAGCDACHRLDDAGRPRPPAADHAPCSDSGCHADEFSATSPIICGGCHVGTEPWRALHHDRPPPAETELGARFSHRLHLGPQGPLSKRACEACHKEASGSRDLRLPRDHAACTGPGCHELSGGAAPALDACEACHAPGSIPGRRRARAEARWSVRARFRHEPHRAGPDGEPLPCAACHDGVKEARGLTDVPTPPKAACAGCHDGETAFKVTGHGCARCHGR